MKLYHGTIYTFEKPELPTNHKKRDFGLGFYATTSENQAIEWTKKKMKANHKDIGYVNVYSFIESETNTVQFKTFKDIDEWIDFVEANRMDRTFKHEYDIVFGKVADDKVYTAFQLYEDGIITREELKSRLLERQDILIDQFSFHSEKAISLLTFEKRIVIETNKKKKGHGKSK